LPRPDPYSRRDGSPSPRWLRRVVRRREGYVRPSFRFDGIAWGAFRGLGPDENSKCDAAELIENAIMKAREISSWRRIKQHTTFEIIDKVKVRLVETALDSPG
jgi:hypothetical protein